MHKFSIILHLFDFFLLFLWGMPFRLSVQVSRIFINFIPNCFIFRILEMVVFSFQFLNILCQFRKILLIFVYCSWILCLLKGFPGSYWKMLNENTEYFCSTGWKVPNHQRTGENGYPCLVPDQRESTQVLSISMILAVVF